MLHHFNKLQILNYANLQFPEKNHRHASQIFHTLQEINTAFNFNHKGMKSI